MKDIVLTNNTSRSFAQATGGDFELTSDEGSFVAQKLRIKYSTAEGEWYLDGANGLDWFGTIFVKGQKLDNIANHIKIKTFEESEVKEIQQLEVEYDEAGKEITIAIRVLIDSGETVTIEVTP